MIMLCERCCTPIDEGEPVVRLAHIDHAHQDGSISWVHSYLHTSGCAVPSPAVAAISSAARGRQAGRRQARAHIRKAYIK